MRSTVSDMSVDPMSEKISWRLDGGEVSLQVPGLITALYSSASNVIAVLSRVSGETALLLLSQDGNIQHRLVAPSGFAFSHLVEHPEHGLCIVCNGDQEIAGWYDWYFKIESRRGSLMRVSPSY